MISKLSIDVPHLLWQQSTHHSSAQWLRCRLWSMGTRRRATMLEAQISKAILQVLGSKTVDFQDEVVILMGGIGMETQESRGHLCCSTPGFKFRVNIAQRGHADLFQSDIPCLVHWTVQLLTFKNGEVAKLVADDSSGHFGWFGLWSKSQWHETLS